MAAGLAVRTVRASGRLVIDPDDLSAAFPHGGTEVGRTRGIVIQSHGEPYLIESEGLGRASDMLEPSKRHTFACMLRGWDDDAIDLLLNDGDTVGSVSGHRVYSVPGSQTPGGTALGRAKILLYVPDDLVNVPAVLVYSGIPLWAPGEEIPFQRGEETVIPLGVECFPDSNDNTLAIGRLVDLSLT